MSDIIDSNNINIDIEGSHCMICTNNFKNMQTCKNKKCSVYICNNCIEKLESDKCPYCRVDNSFEIDNIISNHYSSNNVANTNNIFFNNYIINYIFKIITKIVFLILKTIIILISILSSYYINHAICIILSNHYCSYCYIFPIIFSIIYIFSIILFILNIISKKTFIMCISNVFIINLINSITLTKSCVISVIYLFCLIFFSVLINMNVYYSIRN